ncbi:MAG: sigma-70 family RNA polymerase sigma factor [Rubrobacter sp.]|nr:sigma-70 family RNA polymerase sigma factor [Rubrobacter sp.]
MAGWRSLRRLRPGRPRRSGPSGEEEAELRAVYREHSGELFRVALRSLGDRGLAEEVVQETFVRAWKNRERFDSSRGSFRTWIFSIARNLIVDAARARASRPPGPAEAASTREHRLGGGYETKAREDPIERALTRMQVEEALMRLSEDHRAVISEIYYRGRTYAELAQELDVPAGTLRSRMYYALKSLRLAFDETEISYED